MLIVIADDLTGAAELGGVGLRFGLQVEVQTEFDASSDADLLVIDTDSRSVSPGQAAEKVATVARQIQEKITAPWIYKKTDSVLRGNVRVELQVLRKIFDDKTVLLIPANPSFGRTISNGKYFINDKPLDQTDFANDPDYPSKSADVLQLLGFSAEMDIRFVKSEQIIPKCDIAIGEAESQDDLIKWAYQTHDEILAAGGSEFFFELLKARGMIPVPRQTNGDADFGEKTLIVCGSASDYSRKSVAQARKVGKPVCDMPAGLFNFEQADQNFLLEWTGDVMEAFRKNRKVIIAIEQPVVQNPDFSKQLGQKMAALVENVLKKIKIDELIIEGGATAAAVVHRLEWNKFYPIQEIAPGVVRLKIAAHPELYLTIKPGSYPWQGSIFA